jgi:hypothetical protein
MPLRAFRCGNPLERIVAISDMWNCQFNTRSVNVRFFTFGVVTPIWRDADPDLPILQQAKIDYEKLH